MANWNAWNPFSRRESHSSGSVWVYKILTLVTWLLSVVTSVYYAAKKRHTPHGMPFWDPNHTHPSAFTMSHIMGDVYWGILFVMQFGYVMHLFSRNQEVVNAAASVGSHFILNNLLHFAFVMVFVRGHFIVAELFIVLNFVNLSILYFRHNTSPRFIHGPVASGPLAWTFVAIYWCGAIMIHYQASLAARIVGNVLIWSILVYGLFFIVAFKDYTMGFWLSLLSAAIGVAQFQRQIVALQWIFAFVIMTVLFLSTVTIAVPAWTGRDHLWRRSTVSDAERAPLLDE